MVDGLSYAIYAVAGVLALVSAVLAWRKRRVNATALGVAALLELLLVGQLLVGLVALATSDHQVNTGVFVAYLVGVLFVVPLAVAVAFGEPSRWGVGVVMLAGLAVPVMVARLGQLWSGPSA